VQSAALVTELPLGGQYLSHNFIIAGRPPIPVGSEPDAGTSLVSPDYFRTLEIPVLKGRAFLAGDRNDAPLVAIINQSMAKQYWPGADPIGARVRFARQTGPPQWWTVVGVVGDVKSQGLDQEEGPMIYTPIFQKQEPWRRWATIVVRSSGAPPLQLSDTVKRAVWAFDSQLPLVQVHPMEWLLDDSLSERRFNTLLLGVLAGASLLLAMVGVYGVISFAVSQRTREFGIRMAVGASRANLLRLVIGQGFRVVLLGVALGLIAAAAVTRVLSGMLFGVSAGDALTFVIATLVLTAVALLACYVPARRATKVDPVVALRWE
jgi:putative ABC transport system permease protein